MVSANDCYIGPSHANRNMGQVRAKAASSYEVAHTTQVGR